MQYTPSFRLVHVHHAGGIPDPVLFRAAGLEPLYAGEADFPVFLQEFLRLLEIDTERSHGNGHLHGPSGVFVRRVVQRTVHMYGGFEAAQVPGEIELAPVPVRTVHQEVHHRVQGVQFNFKVETAVLVRVDEHFPVIVLIDNGVVFGERGGYVVLLDDAGDVQVFIVPEHFHVGLLGGLRLEVHAADVGKGFAQGSVLPVGLIQDTVDYQGAGGLGGIVNTGLGGLRSLLPACAGHHKKGRE